MFYYPNVLQRHSGCFSTIWFAATKGIRVTRKELLRVNVKQTCWDILDYVTAQVPPPQPNLPRPRFSLYLSSQLQYGVVVVYHRQCGFLLDEVQQTIDRLLRSKTCIRIDMAGADRMATDVPDSLYMMEEAEGAQDPFFGLMEAHQLPSPYKIHQFVIEEVGPQHSLVSGPHNSQGFRSPPAAITLTDKEQFVTAAECFEGEELPEVTDREIDLLMDQEDQFRREEEERHAEKTRDLEGLVSSIDQLKETMLGAERDSVWLLDEETGQPFAVPLDAVAREMTPPHVAMPTPPSEARGKVRDGVTGSPCEEVAAVPPARRRAGGRRRQLVFADPEVQISDRAMKEQIGTPRAETLDLSEVLLDFSSVTKHATPAQLFSAPCGPLLHASLQLLWKQQATLTVLPGHDGNQRGEEEEEEESKRESEQDREILRTERRRRRQSCMKETSSESGLQHAEGSSVLDVMLDMSKEDRSVSDAITPVGRWSPHEEVQPPMEPIAEENIEMPEAQTDVGSGDMPSWIASSLQRFGEVSFDSLLPADADRFTAAHALHKLLELLAAGQVTVRQTEPYGDISINAA
ncbi:REC8 meiotic recombination protein b [Brachyistius frenatus]|uniref:REC8 meiotic recombination protein b n=1 Tax=Brachyistius frenatus TaxID=100188 RepID=UPI0037E8D30E